MPPPTSKACAFRWTTAANYEGADAAIKIAQRQGTGMRSSAWIATARPAKTRRTSSPGDRRSALKYLLRQMTEIRDGHRRNANGHGQVIKPYTTTSWWRFRLPVEPGDAGFHVQAEGRRRQEEVKQRLLPLLPAACPSNPSSIRRIHPGATRQRAARWKNRTKIVGGLTLIALIAMVAAYFAPIWWVS